MSATFTIPADVLERSLSQALGDAVKSLDIEGLTMVDATEAARLFGITPQAFRKLACDFYDFGERRTRWSLRELRALQESRRVKTNKKNKP